MREGIPWWVALLVGAVACGPDGRAPRLDANDLGAPVPSARLPPTTENYQRVDCWFTPPPTVPVECGRVSVPEEPASPAGSPLSLAVARFFSAAEPIAADPLVYLAGGPGGEAVASAAELFQSFAPLLDHRDLVVFDQRGTGWAEPRLDCEELETVPASDAATETDALLDALSACRERFVASGIDLDAYDSAHNAADVEALRVALGYERWNLYGISYGSRLALTVLRDHPRGVRSAVLDGVVPVERKVFEDAPRNAQRAFELVFAACAAETACAEAYPTPMERLAGAVAAFDADPALIALEDGRLARITGSIVLETLFVVLYDAEAIPYVPALIELIAARDLTLFELLLRDGGLDSGVALGMYFSVVCADDAPFSSSDDVLAAVADLLPLFQGFATPEVFDHCARWGVTPSPPVESVPVVSSVPVLLTSGHLDPVTPPENGDAVAESLLAAAHHVLPFESHGASTTPCGAELVRQFLSFPETPVDASCIARLAARSFELLRQQRPATQARFHVGRLEAETLRRIAERARLRLEGRPR